MKLEIVTVKPESEYFQVEIPGAFDAGSVHILNPMDTKGVRIFTAMRDEWIPQIKRIDPEPEERDNDNRLTWELAIKSGEAVKINVSYTLSYPLGEELLFN